MVYKMEDRGAILKGLGEGLYLFSKLSVSLE